MTLPGALARDQVIRSQLLNFAPADGTPALAALLTGGLFIDEAPDNSTSPYGVLRVTEAQSQGDASLHVDLMVELMLFARNSSQRAALRQAADVAQEALWRFLDTTTGTLFLTDARTQVLPPYTAPGDRELIAIRVAATGYWYPLTISQYANQAA